MDGERCADPAVLEGLGERQVAGRAKAAALALDPAAAVRRSAKAEQDRRVGCRSAPDTMASLSALLPAPAAVAGLKSLTEAADAGRAAGDPRSRGQLMADTLVERVTGGTTEVPARIEIQLVMTDRALIQADTEPARLPGYGIVPAQTARTRVHEYGGASYTIHDGTIYFQNYSAVLNEAVKNNIYNNTPIPVISGVKNTKALENARSGKLAGNIVAFGTKFAIIIQDQMIQAETGIFHESHFGFYNRLSRIKKRFSKITMSRNQHWPAIGF